MVSRKFQIFVSSTYTDLKEERQAAVEAVLKAGHIPAGMELFAAGDESQMQTIRRWIDASDIYMLILGGRYGSLDAKSGLSYVELEYDYAVTNGKPVFAVAIDEDCLQKKVRKKGTPVIETEHSKEYKAFRDKVLGKTSKFFRDCKDIELAVHESISDLRDRYKLTGWVPASEVADSTALLAEIDRLTGLNAALAEENSMLQNQVAKSSARSNDEEAEFLELTKVLRAIEIESKLFVTPDGQPLKGDLLNIFQANADLLVNGVTNESVSGVAVEEAQRFFYFTVCPKLQIHKLMLNTPVSGVRYRRYSITKKGTDLLAYLQKAAVKQSGALLPVTALSYRPLSPSTKKLTAAPKDLT